MDPVAAEALQSAVYIETYLDCVETLPDDLQRHLSRIRDIDVNYTAFWRDVTKNLDNCFIDDGNELTPVQANKRSRAIARIQQSLIAAQELGDEKLQVLQLLQDLIYHKCRQLDLDYRNLVSCLDYNNGNKDEATSIESNSVKDLNLGNNFNSTNTQNQSGNDANSNNRSSSPVLEKEKEKTDKDKTERGSKRARRTRMDISNNDSDPNGDRDTNSPPPETSQRSSNNANSGTGKKAGTGKIGAGKKKKRKTKNTARDETPPPEDPDPIDPDEPTYCLCDQISFGEMILCDNDLCPIEWFHFSCVSLSTKPKGKWFCPKCRGDRPNIMKPKVQFFKVLERYNKEKEEKA